MEEERLSKNDQVKEEIRYATEWLKIFAALLAVTVGGWISLVLEGMKNGTYGFFCAIGLILSVVLLVAGYETHHRIQKLIKL